MDQRLESSATLVQRAITLIVERRGLRAVRVILGGKHIVIRQQIWLRSVLMTAGLTVATASGQPMDFQNATVQCGVDFAHWVPDPATTIFSTQLARMSAGVCAGDFDGDGWVDLYVTRIEAPNLLFRNNRDGTFADVAFDAGVDLSVLSSGCAWADVNNDGLLDLYVMTVHDANRLYVNDGKGGFFDEAAVRGVDLSENSSLRNSTSTSFGDYDRDGDLDMHVTEWLQVGAFNRLLRNDGDGYFSDVTKPAGVWRRIMWGFTSRFADVTGDGWVDLLVAADFSTSRLFENLRDGRFSDITAAAGVGGDENGMGSCVGDIDNDGDLDWFVTAIFDADQTCETKACVWGYTGNRFYRNQGQGTFLDDTDVSGVRDGGWGWGATMFDFDNDGDLDIVQANGVDFPSVTPDDKYNNDCTRLWVNDGTGTMTDESANVGLVSCGSGKGVAVFDYDHDGDLDVYIANNADLPDMLENLTGNVQAWLRVELTGRQTNRFGVGARVFVQIAANGVEQMREVSAGSNYMSQDEITAHFGLGGADVTVVNRVRVEWPTSGRVQVFSNVAARTLMLVTEPLIGDLDDDGGVDLTDHAAISSCLSGPDVAVERPWPLTGTDCASVFDFTGNGRIDLADYAVFQTVFSIP